MKILSLQFVESDSDSSAFAIRIKCTCTSNEEPPPQDSSPRKRCNAASHAG